MSEKNSEINSNSERQGCSHYARKCMFVSPCCKKFYPCRICHDETEKHEIDRTAVQRTCEGCSIVFGKYYCSKCNLFDDEDKGQFHCDKCGLCRVGGKSKFFHCDKCGMCLSTKLRGKHKCIEDSSRRNCAVCLEDLHTSRIDAHIPPCGHLIHRIYFCPTCAQSLFDMKEAWRNLDEDIANTPMPEEYRNMHVGILCRDCHKESSVLFHVIGLKCSECGSYNTCRSADPENGAQGDAPAAENQAEAIAAENQAEGNSNNTEQNQGLSQDNNATDNKE
ncbi:ZN363-like protein [Mya arenaria]|uniref:ZN363-like protein n=1 Tax=Mya arenaria TaxID=6604 RepID=A0ABY7FL87_MYAAR|nr:ZN363-like protein [Mya arenaria]WAR22815.1 ZN363-like protein [Mya arenaria]